MTFIKKQAAGFYFSILSTVFVLAGLIFYLINCNTSYFLSYGRDSRFLLFAGLAIALELVLIIASQKFDGSLMLDVLYVAATVLVVLAFVRFLTLRINSIASIITFQNNAQTMSDLMSAIYGMVCMALGFVVAMIASFLRMTKEA